MPAVGLVFALLVVGSIVGTVALWYVIERETDDNPRMDRADAERAARQDRDHGAATDARGDAGSEDEERGDPGSWDDESSDDWGSDAEWGVDDQRR